MLVVTVYGSANTPSDDRKSLIFCNFARYSPKVCKIFTFLANISCENMPIIFASGCNVNVKDNYNVDLVEFIKENFELDVI
jgi:hypothetical protein